MTGEFANLPADLPRPVDDGAAAHLTGMSMPRLTLRSTAARDVDLGALLLSEDGLAGAFYARWMGTQYPVLAAARRKLAREVSGEHLLKRLTLIVRSDVI
jgi:hypothetical protein